MSNPYPRNLHVSLARQGARAEIKRSYAGWQLCLGRHEVSDEYPTREAAREDLRALRAEANATHARNERLGRLIGVGTGPLA